MIEQTDETIAGDPVADHSAEDGPDSEHGASVDGASGSADGSSESSDEADSVVGEDAEGDSGNSADEDSADDSDDSSVEAEEIVTEDASGSGEAEDAKSDDEAEDGDVEDGDDAETADVAAEDQPAPVKAKSPYDRPGKWFVLHTQSGYENKVKTNLEARIQSMNMEERIFEVVIPLEDVVEFKNGKKVVVQKKVFPGYLLTRMMLNDDSWFVVRNTPGVTGFAGAGNTPVPMRRSEVEQHLSVKDEAEEVGRKGRPRLEYGMGETVRVKEGPFADFQGEIVEINEDQLKVKVLVNIFGRETPVELEFAQVGKV